MAQRNTSELCRLCLKAHSSLDLLRIFAPFLAIQEKFRTAGLFAVHRGDGSPEKICAVCHEELVRVESLIRDFEENRNKLLQSIKLTAEGHLVGPLNMDNVCLLCSSEVELLAFPDIRFLPFPAKLVVGLSKFKEVLYGGVFYTEVLKSQYLAKGICTECFQRLNDIGTFIDMATENESNIIHLLETASESNPEPFAVRSGGPSQQVQDAPSTLASPVEAPSGAPDIGSPDDDSNTVSEHAETVICVSLDLDD